MSSELKAAPRRRRKPPVFQTIPATVIGSEWITPRMVRLKIHSDRMAGFVHESDPDQFVTVIFPRPGQELIELAPDFNWDYFYGLPDTDRPQARNYTVRRFDLAAGTIDVDVLVHGGPGLGEHWAINVKPGAPVYLWGPRIAYNPFPNATFFLLFCDECAVPAAAAIIDSLPADARGHLVAEVKNEAAIPPMPVRHGITVDWVFSDDVEPGESDRLAGAVQQVPVPNGELVYAWGGGEMKAMRHAGRHLRKHWGLGTSSISATGYWRVGQSNED
ncbi:MAG: siderophore-interacting protein [Thermomicrobiales bacterium]|nr:siderophore-interacting protein [Thermomicrobiales bacterium]